MLFNFRPILRGVVIFSRLAYLLATSVAVAGCAFVTLRMPFVSSGDLALLISFSLTAVWAFLLRLAIVRYRKQGLWVLIGAPLALFYPIVYIFWMRACAHNLAACP